MDLAQVEGLVEASDGMLYGMTYYGGEFNNGVIYSINPNNNSFSKRLDFSIDNEGGIHPIGKLVETPDGNLFGVTAGGGASTQVGTIFEYNPFSNNITIRVDFEVDSSGYIPTGNLLLASNNKLYGSTQNGGLFEGGVLFEYDLTNNEYTAIHSFNGEPICAVAPNIVEILPPLNISIKENNLNDFSVYPNPCTDVLFVKQNSSSYGQVKRISIEVIDITGRSLLYQKNITLINSILEIELDESIFCRGYYFIKVTPSGDLPTTLRFVKM